MRQVFGPCKAAMREPIRRKTSILFYNYFLVSDYGMNPQTVAGCLRWKVDRSVLEDGSLGATHCLLARRCIALAVGIIVDSDLCAFGHSGCSNVQVHQFAVRRCLGTSVSRALASKRFAIFPANKTQLAFSLPHAKHTIRSQWQTHRCVM